jgi:hypothetical protein
MLYGFSVAKEGGESRYSPPFRRQGSSATFVFEVLGVYNSPNLTITLQAKDVEDTAYSDTATTGSVTGTGTVIMTASSLKQLLRFRFDFGAGDAPSASAYLVEGGVSWRQ